MNAASAGFVVSGATKELPGADVLVVPMAARPVSVGVGSNGYIVRTNPVSTWKAVK